jgi:hypothetical protein
MAFAGFCTGGFHWPALEVPDDLPPERRLAARRRLAAEDARLIRSLGGNMMRIFWSLERVIVGDGDALAAALGRLLPVEPPVFMRQKEEQLEHLDLADQALDQLMRMLDGSEGEPFSLDVAELDAVLEGIEEVNRESPERVHVLLALVCPVPKWILEAPSEATLAEADRRYTFETLWQRYTRLHELAHRLLVRRYAAERPLTGLVALETFNEPDYLWVPEEMKIESSSAAEINPTWKYITELHLAQVPTADVRAPTFQRAWWGWQPQDGPWVDAGPEHRTPVLDFEWGVKFDWYVKCYGQLMARVARGIKEEAAAHNVEVATVSGSVTHNNIDYLLRVRRAEPNAFKWIDKIGLHPYHWVRNDVWDAEFVSDESLRGWHRADPRTFAESYFKRFDFLRAFAGRSGDRRLDRELRDLVGHRPLWITEFGIGSKVLGTVNADITPGSKLIRPRALVGATPGHPSAVWEDLWSAFLDQVDAAWLRRHGVECLLLYALRERGVVGFDLNDDDRSNLALLARDGRPRLDPPVLARISALARTITGQPVASVEEAAGASVPAELYRHLWERIPLSPAAQRVMTMLSERERQLLHWLTSEYFSGAGAIVDGGCFVGGSTLPLAEGLRASGRPGMVDVYDLFEVEPYMADLYFGDSGPLAGESFRPLFDEHTAHVADLLRVHEGDLTEERWNGDPVEILFIDFAKSWALNDFIVDSFFPALIPGRSVVIQQDFVFSLCPWVVLTMERLSDCFEPVAFVEQCSVVYFCTRPVPVDLEPISSLGHERQLELMDNAIRRFRGYPRDVLECAKATLLAAAGDREQAVAILDRIAANNGEHFYVGQSIELVRSLV